MYYQIRQFCRSPFMLLAMILALTLIACQVETAEPAASPAATRPDPTSTPEDVTEGISGCAEGGDGVFSSADVVCYLDTFPEDAVRYLDDDVAVLFPDPNATVQWIGAAIIYHIPSVSILVLDSAGDVNPSASRFNNRASLVAFDALMANPALMAELKTEVQTRWQMTALNQPELRLGLAWQDGDTAVMLVAIAGLAVEDTSFYCAGETWTIGDETFSIVYDCNLLEENSLVRQSFFTVQEVRSPTEIPVQLQLADLTSNQITFARGEVTVEREIYEKVMTSLNTDELIVLEETLRLSSPARETILMDLITDDVAATVADFLGINQSETSLYFLFQGSSRFFLQPKLSIEQGYGLDLNDRNSCAAFHQEFPTLGGIVSLSQIAFNETGDLALVTVELRCGEEDLLGRIFLLNKTTVGWQVRYESSYESELAQYVQPDLIYNETAKGCGDIFVMAANKGETEFIRASLWATNFSFVDGKLTLEIADHPENVNVAIDRYGTYVLDLGEFPYCNDVAPMAEPVEVWQAESGTITIELEGGAQPGQCGGESYLVTVQLQNVTFSHEEKSVTMPEFEFKDVTVGWCAG